MYFKEANGVLTAFDYFSEVDDAPAGEITLTQGPMDDDPYFYFKPAAGVLLSCRQCRAVSEKLAELNKSIRTQRASFSAAAEQRGD